MKSTAILFGQYDKLVIGVLQISTLMLMYLVGRQLDFRWPFYLAGGLCIGLFGYQQWLIKDRVRELCFKAFLHNHYVGLVMALGVIGHYWL